MPRSPRPKKRAAAPSGSASTPLTLKTLAEHLGLSRSTVSLVLNDSPVAQGLTAQTRERVLKAAAEFNYKPNYFARVLNKKRSHMVGILSSDLNAGYNSELLTAMESLFIERNYLYFVSGHHWDEALIQQRLEVFAERGAEGIILINTHVAQLPNLPVVSIGGFPDNPSITRVVISNESAAQMALAHLYRLGHRRIAYFVGHAGSSDTEPRWSACQRACASLGLPVDPALVVQLERLRIGLDPIREGYVALQKLLRSGSAFTALLGFNDLSAIGAIQALRAAGKRVPEDVSVVGFDDILAASVVQPALTTIRQPLEKMGSLAATELLARIDDPTHAVTDYLIEPELIVRGSTAPPNR